MYCPNIWVFRIIMSPYERKKRNMAYRDKIEIISDVLEAANGGAIKIRIMHKAMLSYKQMKEYVHFLAEKGLLEYGYQQHVQIVRTRSEEHTSELQSRQYLVCRLLLEKKKK